MPAGAFVPACAGHVYASIQSIHVYIYICIYTYVYMNVVAAGTEETHVVNDVL